MSEELRDFRCKITRDQWAVLEAESRATGRDHCEIVRSIIDVFAKERRTAAITLHRLMETQGAPRSAKGIAGKARESGGVLRWED